MSGYEQQLHARAEMLDETGELAVAVTAIITGATRAGLDPAATASLRTAVRALDPAGAPPGDQPIAPTGSSANSGFGSDAEFLEAVSDAEDQVREHLTGAGQLQEQVTAALGTAHDDLDRARTDLKAAQDELAAALAMPTRVPCTGCHPAKTSAITEAEKAIASARERLHDATRRISLCEDTTGILDPLTRRLQDALQALGQVPHDLGEAYELIYQFLRSGGQLPRPGRWITGEDQAPART